MTTRTDVKTLLQETASAVALDPSLAAVSVTAECALIGVHEVDVRMNDQVVKSDQPPMLGGDGLGATPAQIALAALGACHVQTYRFWSEKLGIPVDDVTVDIKGALDIQGIFGLRDGVRPGFSDVQVTVALRGPEPLERYEELRRAVDAHSPVLDVFANPVTVTTALSVR